ncbi:hypothetical protein CTEN210_12735 [Chaetoceros tenuissimus]|uniref:Kinesin light chain n=1 Tax=Chaetoceros tenuissimus TaxID=426638 RepID=A0AAD3D201_9STRA|nr:hypothetical protein CTEN210_12735 [Chaetoceros tenuissimus]
MIRLTSRVNASFLKRAIQSSSLKFQRGNFQLSKDFNIRQQILTQSPSTTALGNIHFFSSESNENKEIKIDGVKVEITKSSTDNDSTSNEPEQESSKPKLKKTEQQQAEEEIYELNSYVKQHFQHANYTEGLQVSQEILEKSTQLFGQHHPATASAYNNIGLMQKMIGNFDESRENLHNALKIYKEIVGEDHASYAAALNNLGNLDRSQSMVDENLSSLERMQLNDSAIEYFEEALKIRQVELGEEHVYTITSRTNLGGALAAQVLQSEMMRQKKLREAKEKQEGDDNKEESGSTWEMSKFTKEKWDAAEQHLRAAYRTAVKNPRGEQVVVAKDPSGPKRRDKNLSKKEKQKAAKLRKKQGTNTTATTNMDNNGLGAGDTSTCTLSSAAAGQNLAVFLKSRADLLVASVDTSYAGLDSNDMYAEAKNLYLGALRVRTALKGEYHPDTVSTKFSLAELIDAIGDEAGANVLRQELLDAYQVQEEEEENLSNEK